MWVVNHVWTTNSHSLSVSVDQWEGRWMNESLMWFDINLPFSPVLHSNMATQRSTRLILSGNLWQYRAQFSVKCTTWVVSKLQSSKSRALSSVGSYKQNCCCTLKVLPLFLYPTWISIPRQFLLQPLQEKSTKQLSFQTNSSNCLCSPPLFVP